MFIWSLSSILDRVTASGAFKFLSALIVWILSFQLIHPILQWPLDNPSSRLRASIMFAVASIIIPFAISLLGDTDVPENHREQSKQQKRGMFLLKLTGAAVGFNTVSSILLFLAVGFFYIGWLPTPSIWLFILLSPLLMAYVGVQRIPADRYKMYAGSLQMHPGDPLFLITFLLIGTGIGLFVYLCADILANKAIGISFLIGLAGLSLWRRQEQFPIPDFWLIFIVGTLTPFLMLSTFLFVFPMEDVVEIVRATPFVEIALAFMYVISSTTIWATVQLKNKPILTLPGALGLLLTLGVLSILLQFDLFWGRITTIIILALWVGWGRKRFKPYLWIHAGVGFLIIAIGLSFALAVLNLVPAWANLMGYTALSFLLIWWAYQTEDSQQIQ